jgi:hypothetical protein
MRHLSAKHFPAAFAAAALFAFAVPASAQIYPTSPQPMYSGLYPEMMDDGCCTDFPTHTPSDFVADQLNRQVLDYNAGLRVAPP